MPYKNSAITVCIFVEDVLNGGGKTGDAANLTIRGVGDGTEYTPSSPSTTEMDSTNLKGVYKVSLTAGENNYSVNMIGGKSSTAGVVVRPFQWSNEISVTSSAVASVTGAVGSVTGNVGGNVTGNVGGNVTGTVGGVTGSINVTTITASGAMTVDQLVIHPASGDKAAIDLLGHGDKSTILITNSNTGTPGAQVANGIEIVATNSTAQGYGIRVNAYQQALGFESTHANGVGFQSTAAGQAALGMVSTQGPCVLIESDGGNGRGVHIYSAGPAIRLEPINHDDAIDALGTLRIRPQGTDQDAIVLTPNGTGLPVNSLGLQIRKNTALPNFMFTMLGNNGKPKTGLSITAERDIDGGGFSACANAVTEIGSGWYTIDLEDTDLNGNVIAFKFTATSALDRDFTIVTQQ